MKRITAIAVLASLVAASSLAANSITTTAPTFQVSNTSPSSTWNFLLTTNFAGTYAVEGYDIGLTLTAVTGVVGPTGLSFTGAVIPSSNYVFTQPVNPLTLSTDTASNIFAEDSLLTPSSTETISNVTRNLLTVDYSIAPGSVGVFDVTLRIVDGFNNGVSDFPGQVLANGVITVVPEPSSLVLLSCAAAAWLFWRRRRCR
jgi:hypothetical protein